MRTTLMFVLAVVCASWHVVATLMIYEYLRRRGENVNFLLLRLLSPSYASQYKRLTRAETGHVGALFYHWLIPINVAFALVAVAAAIHFA